MRCTVRSPDRFHLGDDEATSTGAASIKPDEAVDESRKFARYLPFWA